MKEALEQILAIILVSPPLQSHQVVRFPLARDLTPMCHHASLFFSFQNIFFELCIHLINFYMAKLMAEQNVENGGKTVAGGVLELFSKNNQIC